MKLKNILQIYCVLFSYDFLLQSRMKKVRDFFFHHNWWGNRFAEISFRDEKVLISKQDVLQWLLPAREKKHQIEKRQLV